jgi:hypothetical protein
VMCLQQALLKFALSITLHCPSDPGNDRAQNMSQMLRTATLKALVYAVSAGRAVQVCMQFPTGKTAPADSFAATARRLLPKPSRMCRWMAMNGERRGDKLAAKSARRPLA